MEVQQVLEKNRTMHDMMRRATVDALDMQQAAEQLHSLLQCGVYMIDKDGEVGDEQLSNDRRGSWGNLWNE